MIKKIKIFLFRCAFYTLFAEIFLGSDDEGQGNLMEFEKLLTNMVKNNLSTITINT